MSTPLASASASVPEVINAFLAYKRSLNRKYATEEAALRLLERFLADSRIQTLAAVTSRDIDCFLASRPRARPRSHNHLLGVLQRFFAWLVIQDVVATTPVTASPRRNTGQRIPYLFNLAQARRLLEVARQLPDRPKGPRRGLIYETVFALLYGLGLRVGEVARLTVGDLDLDRDVLLIRQTKFAKDRLVPFGPNMATRLKRYLAAHFGTSPPDAAKPLFSFTQGRAVNPGTISLTFHALLPKLALESRPGVASPRRHDLRHSFAVGTLTRWYREGIDPNTRLLHLATFLGHADPASTTVYLTVTSELLDLASARYRDIAHLSAPFGEPS
jgi:site-specific recombinase XerD